MFLMSSQHCTVPFSLLLRRLGFAVDPREAVHIHIAVILIGGSHHPVGVLKELCHSQGSGGPAWGDLDVFIVRVQGRDVLDRKSTRLNSSHL